jgi:hypothetical protein
MDIGLSTLSNMGNGTRRRLDGINYDPDYEHKQHLELYENWLVTEEEHYHRRLNSFKEEFGEDHYIYATEEQRRELVGCFRFSTNSLSNSYAVKKFLPIPAMTVSYYCDQKTLQITIPVFGPVTIALPVFSAPSFIVKGGGYLNVGPASGGMSLSIKLSALPWYLQSSCYAVTWSNTCYSQFDLGTLSLTAGSSCYIQTSTYGNFYADCGRMTLTMTFTNSFFSFYPTAVVTLASNQIVGVSISGKLVTSWFGTYSETLINSWFKING